MWHFDMQSRSLRPCRMVPHHFARSSLKSVSSNVYHHGSHSPARDPLYTAIKKSLRSSPSYLPNRRHRRTLQASETKQLQCRRSSYDYPQRAGKTHEHDVLDAEVEPRDNAPVIEGMASGLSTANGKIATPSSTVDTSRRARTSSGSRVRGVVDEILTQRERERQAVKRENERIMKRRELRRTQEEEAKEVRRAEVYAINAFMRDVYLHHYAAFEEAKRQEEERGEARLEIEEGRDEGGGESEDEAEGGGEGGMDGIGGV